MSTLAPAGQPYNEVDGVGLVITNTDFGLHCAFVYKSDDGEMRTLGLAGHYNLEDEVVDAGYRWAETGLDTDNKEVLRVLLSRIKNNKPAVPYAFDAQGIVFAQDGTLLPPPAGKGLTCATFVVAVFRTYAFEIIDVETWPDTPRDEKQLAVILYMLRRHAGREYVEALRSNKEAISINPDEVVAAGSMPSETWPVDFGTARELADSILQDLSN